MAYKKVFTLRTTDSNIEKLSAIAEQNKRSANAQLEYILELYIDNYEKDKGTLQIIKK